MNRIEIAVANVASKCQKLSPEKLVKLSKTLDMALDEFCEFQNLKSVAMMHGVLSEQEAQYVYGLLGNTPEHFNSQPIQIKSVLTSLFGELLNLRINRSI